jgi:hypothetical protein
LKRVAPVARREVSLLLHLWDPSDAREFGSRYHGIDIYPGNLARSDIL